MADAYRVMARRNGRDWLPISEKTFTDRAKAEAAMKYADDNNTFFKFGAEFKIQSALLGDWEDA